MFIGVSLMAIHLGPLYGIIRENSTFGEVVRAGDSKRKRWFRLRPHIQRSSEIAFFYVNRSRWLTRHEGLIRWGIGFLGLVILAVIAYAIALIWELKNLSNWNSNFGYRYSYTFHAMVLTIQGIGLLLAMFLFSHAKNTTYQRVPFLFGRGIEVSKLDTTAFLFFWLLSTAASIAVPVLFERFAGMPAGMTLFPVRQPSAPNGPAVDFFSALVEATIVISFVGLVLYACHRALCQTVWMKSASITLVLVLYGTLIWIMPVIFGAFVLQGLPEINKFEFLTKLAPLVAAISPMATVFMTYEGKMGGEFPDGMSKLPFYPFHAMLFLITLLLIRRGGRKLREQYMPDPTRERSNG